MGSVAAVKQKRELDQYDPEKGLKQIAVSEAAEKHYARAKDLQQLERAVKSKLEAQRKFVLWWDGLGEKRGGSGSNQYESKRRGSATFPTASHGGMPSRSVIERWRKALKDEAKFLRALADAVERCARICEHEKNVRGTEGTGENEWFTPAEYFDLVRAVLGGIDLDPATSVQAQEIVKADKFFTKEDDGLKHEWHGRVWLNPPYAQPAIDDFMSKMVREREAGHVTGGIMLTHNYTDTSWFHRGAACADAICFTRGRVKVYDPSGEIAAPTQGQAFFYFGLDVKLFVERFSSIGFVLVPYGVQP
jgi:phage N-6-adenine-methyltransferase